MTPMRRLSKQQPRAAQDQPESSQQQEKPEIINLDDAHAIKHKLDSVAVDVVLSAGYVEDHLITNVKITLGLLAICAAVYSHWGVGKFPANWGTVLFCVITYVVLNVVLGIFCYVKEQDAFLVTLPKPDAEYGIRVSSRMERFSDTYTLVISSADRMNDREIKFETSVTDYFHEDGILADQKYRKQVSRLLQQYELLDASSAPRPKAINPKTIPKKLA